MPRGTSRCGLRVSSERVDTPSNPRKAKATMAAAAITGAIPPSPRVRGRARLSKDRSGALTTARTRNTRITRTEAATTTMFIFLIHATPITLKSPTTKRQSRTASCGAMTGTRLLRYRPKSRKFTIGRNK
ncbi:hypothetical protein D3C73_1234500 [compost metagenome]